MVRASKISRTCCSLLRVSSSSFRGLSQLGFRAMYGKRSVAQKEPLVTRPSDNLGSEGDMQTSTYARWVVWMDSPALPASLDFDRPTAVSYFRFWFEETPRSIENTSYSPSNIRQFYRFAAGRYRLAPHVCVWIVPRTVDWRRRSGLLVHARGVHLDHQFRSLTHLNSP